LSLEEVFLQLTGGESGEKAADEPGPVEAVVQGEN